MRERESLVLFLGVGMVTRDGGEVADGDVGMVVGLLCVVGVG